MVLGKVKSFIVSYDCLNDSNVPVFSSGDSVSGRVIIEVTGEIRVKSLKIHAKGFAKVRWTESRNAGSNTAYTQNYTEEVEYLNHRDILIGHERGKHTDQICWEKSRWMYWWDAQWSRMTWHTLDAALVDRWTCRHYCVQAYIFLFLCVLLYLCINLFIGLIKPQNTPYTWNITWQTHHSFEIMNWQ